MKRRAWSNLLRTRIVPPLLWAGTPLIWLRRRLKPHKVQLYRVESTIPGGQSLNLLCGLTGQSKNYFLKLAFDGTYRETALGMGRVMDLFQSGQNHSCDLMVVETSQSHFKWLKQNGWFFIPFWISGEVQLPIPDEFLKQESVKADLRLMRRHQYAYEVTRDEARFRDFYHNMHIPHIRRVFGDAACYDSYAEKRRESENFDLLLIHKKDKPGYDIAGMLIVYDFAGPRMWSLGIRDDGVDYVREGAIGALYHFSIEYLGAGGHRHLSFGNSRAFLRDGVLNYKRKLSQALKHPFWQGFALKISAITPAVKDFLLKNPFVFLEAGQLHAAVFVDQPLVLETVKKLVKSYFHPGLNRLVIHTFLDREEFQIPSLPPELAERIEVRLVKNLAG